MLSVRACEKFHKVPGLSRVLLSLNVVWSLLLQFTRCGSRTRWIDLGGFRQSMAAASWRLAGSQRGNTIAID